MRIHLSVIYTCWRSRLKLYTAKNIEASLLRTKPESKPNGLGRPGIMKVRPQEHEAMRHVCITRAAALKQHDTPQSSRWAEGQ